MVTRGGRWGEEELEEGGGKVRTPSHSVCELSKHKGCNEQCDGPAPLLSGVRAHGAE